MEGIFFKSDNDTIEPVRVWTTPEGKIDFCALGSEFRLDLNSIKLGGDRFPDSNGESKASWMQIKSVLGVVGTREDPVEVSGCPICEIPTDSKYDKSRSWSEVMLLKELPELPQDEAGL